jgi:hypothetical protein
MPDEQALKLRFTIPGEQPGALTIATNLFPYDPQHQTFINIYEGDALRQQLIFRAGAPNTPISSGPRRARSR